MTTDVRITTEDGVQLHATTYGADNGNAWLLINPAMGVRRGFYRHLAGQLAGQGVGVLTYDYRGMGDSVIPDSEVGKVRLEDWGRKDFPAALGWLKANRSPQRVVVLGHSVGGQMLGITPAIRDVDGVVGVASQAGHWRHWSGLERLKVLAFWYGVVPLLSQTGTRFPASLLGLGQNIPVGVARQWAEWGRDRDHIRSPAVGPQPQFYADVRCRLRTYLIEQDNLAPEPAVRAWHDWFPNAEREFINLGSHNAQGRRIGHFGFFDPEIAASEWPALARLVRG